MVSVFIGITGTTYSVTKIKLEGIKWFIPTELDIQHTCGDHWGGLPFSIVYNFVNQKPIDKNSIQLHGICPQEISYVGMFTDLFIWTFSAYMGIESVVKIMKRKKPQL